MTKRRASRFSGKDKKQPQDSFDLEITPAKRRASALDIDEDLEEKIRELEYRLERVREWLNNAEDTGGMDKKNVILPRKDLLLLRGILDDVVNLHDYEDFDETDKDFEDENED